MVEKIVKTIYECPYCHYTDESDDDVAEHIKDHHIDYPKEINKACYLCEACNMDYKTYQEAVCCNHGSDEGIIEAAQHKDQKTLFEVENE